MFPMITFHVMFYFVEQLVRGFAEGTQRTYVVGPLKRDEGNGLLQSCTVMTYKIIKLHGNSRHTSVRNFILTIIVMISSIVRKKPTLILQLLFMKLTDFLLKSIRIGSIWSK